MQSAQLNKVSLKLKAELWKKITEAIKVKLWNYVSVICATLKDEQWQRQDHVFRSKELHFTKGVVQILFMVTNKRKKTNKNKKQWLAGYYVLSQFDIRGICLYILVILYICIYLYISCILALSSKMETFLNSSFANTFFQRSFSFSFLYFIIFSWHICTANLSFKCLCWHIQVASASRWWKHQQDPCTCSRNANT